MTTKLVVLDIAGTTVADDDAVSNAFQKAFLQFGYEIPIGEIKPLMGYKKSSAIQTVLEKRGGTPDDGLIENIHSLFTDEMINHYMFSSEVKPAPNSEEILEWLKEKGIRVALNTGFPREIADAIMNRFQWVEKNLVDEYIASDEVEKGRPFPLMIERLMKSGGIDNPEEVAKIGDTEVDINEGRNAKCGLVVAITTGAFTREQLQEHNPDYIIDNLKELQHLIH